MTGLLFKARALAEATGCRLFGPGAILEDDEVIVYPDGRVTVPNRPGKREIARLTRDQLFGISELFDDNR